MSVRARIYIITQLLATLLLSAACASETTSRTDDALWMAEQGIGQAELLLAGRSVARAAADPETDPQVKHRLRLVQAVRTFARDVLELRVNAQYKRAVFLDSPAVVFVVGASPRTALRAYRWTYPVLGALPYRGFFSLEDAEAEADRMEDLGFDASVRPVRTYSLLGFLPDPLVSPMLFVSDEAWLVETVIHELTHATVFAAGHGAFNEGLATFVGREGRRRFVSRHYGENSAIADRMRDVDKDRDTYAQAVAALAFDLRVLFARDAELSEAEVLAEKDLIFRQHQSHYESEVRRTLQTYTYRGLRLPDNNAELSAYGLYTMQQAIYEQAYAQCQRSMRCLLATLKRSAAADDPEADLERSLSETPSGEVLLR